MMISAFHPQAWEDYLYWQQNDKALLRRINRLIRDIQRDPCTGIGKPASLKFTFSGYWSRRIDDEHRLVYRLDGTTLVILACRYHYR